MRYSYIITILATFACVMATILTGNSMAFVIAFVLYALVLKPAIDCAFIRRLHLADGEPLWHSYPFFNKYFWPLLLKNWPRTQQKA